MRIGFFTYLPLEYGGGVAKYFTEISTGLVKRYKAVDAEIISLDAKTLKAILSIYWIYFFGGQDRNLLNKESERKILNNILGVKYRKVGLNGLSRQLKKYDIIYSTNNLLEVFILKYLIGYKNLPPVIYGFHIPVAYPQSESIQSKIHNMLYSSAVYLNALSGARKLHVLNAFDETWLGRKLRNVNVAKIHNPFNFDRFEKLASHERLQLGWTRRKFNILWAGRLTAQKGVGNLVKIVEMANSKAPKDKIIWNVVGEGELKRRVLDLEKRWNNVKYFGYVQNSQMPSIYKSNDLFISTSAWESFPYNLLEAQSVGLPVVAFDIPGCNEIIDNGKNGYLVKNVKEFSKKITSLSEGKKVKREKIRRYVRQKFSEEKLFAQLYGLFAKL